MLPSHAGVYRHQPSGSDPADSTYSEHSLNVQRNQPQSPVQEGEVERVGEARREETGPAADYSYNLITTSSSQYQTDILIIYRCLENFLVEGLYIPRLLRPLLSRRISTDARDLLNMETAIAMVRLGILLCSALAAPVEDTKGTQKMLFSGEDFHLSLSSLDVHVSFQSRDAAKSETVLMTGGSVVNARANLNSQSSHLVVANVGEDDEGTYYVKNKERPDDDKAIRLIVRDCSIEDPIKYGGSFHIKLAGVLTPITLEYKLSGEEANLTSKPAQVIYAQGSVSPGRYQGRLNITEHQVSIREVTGADKGSYTVKDANRKVMRKVCLNVLEHRLFEKRPYGGSLKIYLIAKPNMVHLFYTPDFDLIPRQILNQGQLTVPADLDLEGRISLESSMVILDRITTRDAGKFRITDMQEFAVSTVDLEVFAYRLPTLYVTIIALVGLLVFLLLVCLFSCLFKQRKRAAKDRDIEKIAQNAGKEDEGDAFREVVKNITQFEESMAQSTDITEKSQSTEVDIKGLEVSSKEMAVGNLETSDSGVEFNTSVLPLDTDTDQIPESETDADSVAIVPQHKPSLDPEIKNIPEPASEPKLTITKPVETKLSPIPSPVYKLSPSPTVRTPELKTPEAAKTPTPVSPSSASHKPTPPLTPVTKPTAPQLLTPEHPKPLTPTPESTIPLTPTPESNKPVTPTTTLSPGPAPSTNGTPEPPAHNAKPESVPVPATPPKNPEVELTGPSGTANKDTLSEDTVTT
ncbi:hypothetical protein DPEC_G00353910 [Dallia pectoralis]|uniref:Uncharacterized protein n=1 Tax=Dallia pectoralis TaxID=75939 RepID=A0ACC2F2L8_DALPE|nr:hypothetical protein DPEC_G00353910 [Dallia pectoralis]